MALLTLVVIVCGRRPPPPSSTRCSSSSACRRRSSSSSTRRCGCSRTAAATSTIRTSTRRPPTLPVMGAFPNINTGTTKTYRRVYRNLQYDSVRRRVATLPTASPRVPAVWDPANALTSNAPADIAFMDPTRYAIAKNGLAAAVSENASSIIAGASIRLRQTNAGLARLAELRQARARHRRRPRSPSATPPPATAGSLATTASTPRASARRTTSQLVSGGTTSWSPPANDSATSVLTIVRQVRTATTLDSCRRAWADVGYDDRPLTNALDDARAAAIAAMTADTATYRAVPQHDRHPHHRRQGRRRPRRIAATMTSKVQR